MDFKSYKDEGKKLGISSGDFYKLQLGENKIRVLSNPEATVTHFINKTTAPAICGTGCELCYKGVKQTFKVALYILDRADETIKFAELPWSIYKALGELANSSEYGFEGLPPYDLIVTKTGEGMDTRYAVTPGRNETPLTAAQKKELAAKKPVKEILAAKAKQTAPMNDKDIPDLEEAKADVGDLPWE